MGERLPCRRPAAHGVHVVTRRRALLLGTGALLLACSLPVPDEPAWERVVGDGFGDRGNLGVSALHVFRGHVLAATNRRDNAPDTFGEGTGTTQLFRSADGESFERLSHFDPPLHASNHAIFFVTDAGGQDPAYAYLSTPGAPQVGPSVYRSADGVSWTRMNGAGSGFVPTGNLAMTALAILGSHLYSGTRNDAGAQLWRIPQEATSGWELVLDLAAVDPRAIVITCLSVFQGALYVGTLGKEGAGAQIHRSETGAPGSFERIAAAGDGLGAGDNMNVADFAQFDGFLYASTQNRTTGGELYRSSDGRRFAPVVTDGLGDPLHEEIHRMTVAFGRLWITTFSVPPARATTFVSTDGLRFSPAAPPGFGDAATAFGYPSLVALGPWMLVGVQNKTTGAQVWRLRVE